MHVCKETGKERHVNEYDGGLVRAERDNLKGVRKTESHLPNHSG
jgi:hypothetical protein